MKFLTALFLLCFASHCFASLASAQDVTLQVLHFDQIGGRSEYRYYLQTPKERIELKLKHAQKWRTGDKVRVRGKRTKNSIEVQAITPLTLAALPNTTGPRKVAVLLFNYLDNPVQPWTPTQIQQTFDQVSDFYAENSYGKTTLEGLTDPLNVDVYGWFTSTFAVNGDCGAMVAAVDETQKAAVLAGLNLDSYDHIVQIFPRVNCWWDGFAEIGGRKTWVNGNLYPGIVSHEIGHNLGLYHSHSLSCILILCSFSEYGDLFDTMGGTLTGHFNAGQKEDLGWLSLIDDPFIGRFGSSEFPPLINVTKPDGTYWITPYEAANLDPKGLKIAVNGGSYYVEHRAGLGFDAVVPQGVIIHFVDETIASGNYLLDIDPTFGVDWTLDQGQVFADGVVTITNLSVNSTGATVHVKIE